MKETAKETSKINKAIKELEDMSDEELLYKREHCLKCNKKIVPDKKAVIFGTKRWDSHTFKFNCDCFPKNIRICVG